MVKLTAFSLITCTRFNPVGGNTRTDDVSDGAGALKGGEDVVTIHRLVQEVLRTSGRLSSGSNDDVDRRAAQSSSSSSSLLSASSDGEAAHHTVAMSNSVSPPSSLSTSLQSRARRRMHRAAQRPMLDVVSAVVITTYHLQPRPNDERFNVVEMGTFVDRLLDHLDSTVETVLAADQRHWVMLSESRSALSTMNSSKSRQSASSPSTTSSLAQGLATSSSVPNLLVGVKEQRPLAWINGTATTVGGSGGGGTHTEGAEAGSTEAQLEWQELCQAMGWWVDWLNHVAEDQGGSRSDGSGDVDHHPRDSVGNTKDDARLWVGQLLNADAMAGLSLSQHVRA